jgi:WD40 repeat protein
VDPERSILLAMQAISTTYVLDGTTTKEAAEALHRTVLNSRLRLALYSVDGYGLALSPDGKWIATSTSHGQVKLWDLNSRNELFTLSGHEGWISFIAFSPDGSRLASASGDGTAKVWNLDTKQVIHDLSGHTDQVISATFSPDGKRIVTASLDGTAKVWDAAGGELLLTFTGHATPLLSAQFSPDGARIATTGDDDNARVWDSSSGQELYILSDFTRIVSGAAFSPDGTILATNGGDDPKLWDAATGELLFVLPGGSGASAQLPVFTPDGRYVAVAGQDGKVSMWDTATGRQYLTFATGTPVDSQIGFSHDCTTPSTAPYPWCGSFLVTGNRDGSVRFWDVTPTGQREVLTLPGFWNCLAPDGRRLYTAAEADGGDLQIHTWQFTDTASVLQPSNPLAIPGREISLHSAGAGDFGTVGFTPDCAMSSVFDQANLTATITDTENGEQLLQFQLAAGTPALAPIGASSLSLDGTRLAAVGPGNTAKVYDLEKEGRELLTLEGHAAPLLEVSFSPDGKSISTTSQDNSVKLWDAETGQELSTFSGHTSITSRVVFSPDGTRLATSSFDRTVKVWDIETGDERFTLTGHGATVWAIAFSPDGKLIATGSNDRTFRLWDAETGKPLLTIPVSVSPTHATFTPDSTRLILSTINGETHVYLTRIDDLYALAQRRVTRSLTTEECEQYLHVPTCPTER